MKKHIDIMDIRDAIQNNLLHVSADKKGMVFLTDTQTEECICITKDWLSHIEPIRHGHWIDKDMGDYEECICSVCGEENFGENYMIGSTAKYCPHCGAKMDEVME